VITTTKRKTEGIYLPPDDHRHYVAWSERTLDDFGSAYLPEIWKFYENGGFGHVAAFLRSLDLTGFDPKAVPSKTLAWYAIVSAGTSLEDAELRDVIEADSTPDAITIDRIIAVAHGMDLRSIAEASSDRRLRRAVPHKMERAGYVPVRNTDADDGLWKVQNRRVALYARRDLTFADQVRAARNLARVDRYRSVYWVKSVKNYPHFRACLACPRAYAIGRTVTSWYFMESAPLRMEVH
jgi:hypothetical protein